MVISPQLRRHALGNPSSVPGVKVGLTAKPHLSLGWVYDPGCQLAHSMCSPQGLVQSEHVTVTAPVELPDVRWH